MSEKYEIVVIFNPDVEGDALGDELSKIEDCVKNCGGQVDTKEIWGRRQLAYPIQDRSYGNYVVVVATASNNFVSTLRRQLRLNENVMRELVVKKDKFAPDLVIEKQERRPMKKFGYGDDLGFDADDLSDIM